MKMYNNILVTATNSPYYSSLLTLISNVHKDSLEVVDRIFVFNLGLEENEINYLNTLKNVEVLNGLFGSTGIQLDEGYPDDYPLLQFDVTEKLVDNLNKNEGKELNIRVDTENMGDPAHSMRKFLVMMIKIGENIYRITYNEGFNVGLKFN